MEAMVFPVGTTYLLICAANDGSEALRISTNDHKQFHMARVQGAHPDPNDMAQLWMVEKTGLEDDSYEIVNCISGNVFDEEKNEIRLKKGKQISDQLFKIERIKDDFYWIKLDQEGGKAVSLEGVLRYRAFNPNDPSQIFRFIPIRDSDYLEKSCILINTNSGKALDVPSSSFEPDTRIIQYRTTKRFNQRWLFVKQGRGYMIQSLLNGLVLDISGESTQGGSAVIQWPRTGATNQCWMPQPAGNGVIKLASVHAPGMYLCIKNQSMEDFGKLEIWDQDNPSMYWRVEGQLPSH